jgi:hypothetical protein
MPVSESEQTFPSGVAPKKQKLIQKKTAVSKVFPDRDFQRKMFDKLCEFYKLHAIPYFQNINNVPASSV